MFKIIERGKYSEYYSFGVELSSFMDEDYGEIKNVLRLAAFGYYVRIRIPSLIQPKMVLVNYLNSNGNQVSYTKYIDKRYGFVNSGDALHISYGIQPNQWVNGKPEESDHVKVIFYPWRSWYRIGHYIYAKGSLVIDRNELERKNKRTGKMKPIEEIGDFHSELEKIPKHTFVFDDYDGEEIVAKCYVEKSIYRINNGGKKNFWWFLPLFIKDRVYNTLMIDFTKEVGKRKGSWKGGTTGHSIELLDGETPFEAFIRYGNCVDYRDGPRKFSNIRYLGEI